MYRSDIDGLRAIAVFSVVFYHVGFDLLSGGYVGVDIFFVISGYLITSIIIRELNTDSFSISRFYERRFRRILPALLVMVVVTTLIGTLFYNPTQLTDLSKSVVATMIFSSNILFFWESGYFDTASELKPLLHTWSLAVEEQFYIVFPIIMLCTAKFANKRYLIPLFLTFAVSLLVSVLVTTDYPTASFYLIHTRTWELLLGSTLALKVLPELHSQKNRDIFSIIGFLCLTFSILMFDEHTIFPGYTALLPTIGAALLIYSGGNGGSIVGKLLSLKPIVFIGLISYSLYLWHWPLIVFTNYLTIRELTIFETFTLLVAMLILATLSWNFVEKPFRTKKIFPLKKQILQYSALSSICLTCIGLYIVSQNGLPQRFAWYQDTLAIELENPDWKKWGECQNVVHRIKTGQELCNIGDTSKNASFLFWGDSHARVLIPTVEQSAKKADVNGKVATQSACPPLLGIERRNRLSCSRFNNTVVKYLTNADEIETVILAARWALASTGIRYKSEKGSAIQMHDLSANSKMNNQELFVLGLERTINALLAMNKKIVIVAPIPEVGYDVPAITFVSQLQGRNLDTLITPTLAEFNARNMPAMNVINELAIHNNISVIHPSSILCDFNDCKIKADGELLYRDDDHLTAYGSTYISSIFKGVF